MACLSCTKNKTEQQISILQKYKENYERTGKNYLFFQKKDSNEIHVTDEADFKRFKEANKKDFDKGLYEFRHIREFGDIKDTDVLVNTENKQD